VNDDVFAEINVVGDDAAFQLTVVFDSDAIVKNAVSGTSVNNFFLFRKANLGLDIFN
jgi:hypothetical protein